MESRTKKYITKKVDIKRPREVSKVAAWWDDLWESRGQIGMLTEFNTAQNDINWTSGNEGKSFTK